MSTKYAKRSHRKGLWIGCWILIFGACSTTDHCYQEYGFGQFTSYEVNVNAYTPLGIGVDDPKHELDPEQIDQTVKNVVACVANIADSGFTDEEFTKGECYIKIIDAEIKHCLVVKVPPDWSTSKCSGEQVFPCATGDFRCAEKGLSPSETCPCMCRGIIQDGDVVLITPNLRLLPGTLTTLFTGCLSPWVGRLAECSSSAMIAK